MKNVIKRIIKMVLYGYKGTSESYVLHLKKVGVAIGDNVVFHNSQRIVVDEAHPHMLSIGDRVNITGDTVILCHDYSPVAARNFAGGGYANIRPVTIGNDVFIGWGVIILSGAKIGDNVIIGAGSVVSGNVESNSVYAGNPARKIMSMEQYVQRLSSRQRSDADILIEQYKKRFGTEPPDSAIGNYRNVLKTQK